MLGWKLTKAHYHGFGRGKVVFRGKINRGP